MDYARVIERSLRFIEENLGQPLSLSQVAEQFTSPSITSTACSPP